MASIPSYLLRNLYVKGSLRNVEDGFQFSLRNNLYPATLTGLIQAEVDGEIIEADDILVGKGEEATQKASEVGHQKPLSFYVGETLVIKVLDKALEPGEHEITLTVSVVEIGRLDIPIIASL